MPAPTRDSRPWKDYCWVLPDKNQVELTIAPHGDATLLFVDVTSLNASDADLPEGIQVYPGATIQNASPGMVMFQANASLEKVKAFYQDSLKAAGWSSNGEPVSSGKAVLMNWQKDNQTVMQKRVPPTITDTRIFTHRGYSRLAHLVNLFTIFPSG